MINYKDFFDRALSEAFDKYTFSDADELMKSIKERAEGMSNNNEKTTPSNVTDISEEYGAPKKNRVFGAVVGTAVAAAVISGIVLGAGWLNEHGGLKEGGIETDGGPGYHDDSEQPAQSTAETTNALIAAEDIREPADILQAAGDVIEFSDMTAEVKNVEYDGQFLKVILSTEYHGEDFPSDTEYVNVVLKAIEGNKYVGNYTIDERYFLTDRAVPDPEDANKRLHILCVYVKPDPGETAAFTFEYYSPAEGHKREQLGEYTLTGVNMNGVHFKAEDAEKGINVTVSSLGAAIESPQIYADDDHFSVVLRYKDGTETVLVERETTFGETAWSPDRIYDEYPVNYTEHGWHGVTYIMSIKADPLDIGNIEAVLINGEEVGGSGEEAVINDDAVPGEGAVSETTGIATEEFASFDALIGQKMEFAEMYITLKSYTPCGRFVKMDFDVEYKKPDNIMMPLMNLGQISWYPVDGAPFDSKIYCANYRMQNNGSGKADFSLTLYNELEKGQKIDTVLQCMHFDNSAPSGDPMVWEKGADITVYGLDAEPEYESRQPIVIASNENGDATLDYFVISGPGMRLDVSYPKAETAEEAGFAEVINVQKDMLFDIKVVLRYKDGTESRTLLDNCNYYTDNVNHRRMFYLFNEKSKNFEEPLQLESVTLLANDGTTAAIYKK